MADQVTGVLPAPRQEKDKEGNAPGGVERQGPTSDNSSVISEAVENVDDSDTPDQGQQPSIPFSKGRCIALVATVMGASFLNVGAKPPWVIFLT